MRNLDTRRSLEFDQLEREFLFLRARARTQVGWISDRAAREQMTARFQVLAARTPHAGHGARLARAHFETRDRCQALLHRPNLWPLLQTEPQAREVLSATDRGVLITTVHAATMWLVPITVRAAVGRTMMVAVGEELLGPDPSAPADPYAAIAHGDGADLVPSAEYAERLGNHLVGGGIAAALFDVPGYVEVELLGKRTLVSRWVARLALATGAVILPSLAIWDARLPTLRCAGPFAASAGDTVDSLSRRVARAIDPLLRAAPHHQVPYVADLWPDDVGPHGWAFPPLSVGVSR